VPEEPVFFLKPETALLPKRNPFVYPSFSNNVQYETEIVIRINRLGKHIHEKFAHKYYNQVGIGIDFTARDVQQTLKQKGLPWEKAKAFDGSAPVSPAFLPVTQFQDIQNIHFSLQINGETRQQGNTADMLFPVNKIIAYVSQFVTLKIGDLIFTGTPAGVGQVNIGDTLECFIEDISMLKFNVK
jgi:2-keto-4-pentenoate hydratase/2-oxohepta-3-ene-1,7-dioic acid hydratase in catechol pathway